MTEKLIPFLEKRGFRLVEKLQGDASSRQFYRVEKKGERFVLMVFTGEGLDLQLQVHRFLSALWPLPRIYEIFPRALLMEDAGDLSLEEAWRKNRKVDSVYRKLLHFLRVLQNYGPGLFPANHPVRRRALNGERFLKELDFTFRHFIEERYPVEEEQWREAALELVESIDYSTAVPNHRDFHSRNIFLKGGKILILDYQDCMMGPPEYDYASLLRDNYVKLTPTLRRRLEKNLNSSNYILVSLQRHLKALGTFGFQIKKGKTYFKDYIPITLEYLAEEIKNLNLKMALLIKGKILQGIYND